MGETLLVSVVIGARDLASRVFATLGANGMHAFSPLQIAAVGVAAGIAAIGIASITAATSFDQSMHKVAALSDMFQKTGYTMQWYQNQLLALAPQIDVAPTKLAQALYYVASAGFRGQQAIDVLRYSAEAAAASMGDMSQTTDMITSALNAYAGAGYTVGQVTDTMMTALVQGKMEMHALTTSFSFVAVTARNAGMSLQETAAAVASLTRVSGESGARRMQMDLMNLIRNMGDVKAMADRAKKLGLSWNEAAYATSNFAGRLHMLMQATGFTQQTLDQLRAKAHGNEQQFEKLALQMANNNSAFKAMAGGAAAFLPAAVLLTNNGKVYNDILSKMTGNGEKTADAFAKMRESTGQQWNMFKVTLQSIATVLGLQLLPTVNHILGPLIQLGRGIIAFVQTSAGINALKTALLGIAAVIGGILIGVIGQLVVAMAPFIGAFAGIVAAGILVGKIIQVVVAHFGGWHAILQKLQPVLAMVGKALGDAGAAIKRAFADPAIGKAFDQFKAALPELLPLLKGAAIILGGALFVGFKLVVGAILLAAKALPLLIGGLTLLVHFLGLVARFWGAVFGGQATKAIGDFFGRVGEAIGDFFGGIGAFIGSKLGGAGAAIGNFFSGLGTIVHNGLMTVLGVVTGVFHAIGNFFPWLYHHNYYVQAVVDFIHVKFLQAKAFLMMVLVGLQAFIRQKWQQIQQDAHAAWQFIYQHIITPVQQVWSAVTSKIGQLKDWLLARWNDIKNDVARLWNGVVSFITGLTGRMGSAVHDHVVKPIQDKIGELIKNALDWGANLIKMFVKGITDHAGDIANAAKNALGGIAKFLGFHSPAPAVPESAYWGRNLIQMFASSMLTAAPQVGLAAARVLQQAQRQLASGSASASLGVAAAAACGRAFSVAGAATGGGSGITNVTNNVTFPGVKDKDEIKKAMQELEQANYRAGRRPGMYGGLSAHTTRQ